VSMREDTKRCWSFLPSICEFALSSGVGGWFLVGMEADGRKKGREDGKTLGFRGELRDS
jgi:hypothetical protein